MLEVVEVDPYTLAALKQCVAFLYNEELEGERLKKNPVGTCFFVAVPNNVGHSLYLITAKHVRQSMSQGDGSIYVRLNKTGIAAGVKYVRLPEEGWIEHPNSEVDLALLPWFPQKDLRGITLFALPLDVLAKARDHAGKLDKPWPPEECEEVFFIGLMLQYQGDERNFPIVRMGHIALNTDEPIDAKTGRSRYRVIESQGYRGNSGSPAWVYYGDGKPYCFLGMLTTMFRSEHEIVGKDTYYTFGIGLVVPGEFLVEMLNMEEIKKKENGPSSSRMTFP